MHVSQILFVIWDIKHMKSVEVGFWHCKQMIKQDGVITVTITDIMVLEHIYKQDLRHFLKLFSDSELRASCGKEFHSLGAEHENAPL